MDNKYEAMEAYHKSKKAKKPASEKGESAKFEKREHMKPKRAALLQKLKRL